MSKKKILVVEDEAIVAKNIQRCLNKLGYTVPSIVATGEDAIKKVEDSPPDLVLMDIELLGEMDGIEAAKLIKSRFDIPVIYLTAYADEKTLERAKITEPFGYITKPFEDRDLHGTIEMALYKHKTEEALNKQREKFISVLIHDLKGPLVPIIGFTKRLIEGKTRSEQDRTATLKIILESAENLLEVIKDTSNSLKKRASLQFFNPEQVEFNDILLNIVMNTMPEIEDKEIEIFINNKNSNNWDNLEKIVFKADPSQLKTLVENLLGNAIRYANSKIKIELKKRDSEIYFMVSDDGPGIPEIYHKKIFEEYFQVPGSKIGTGVGLYSVKKVVENHNGKIVVHSFLNKGTSFEITFPC